MLHNNVNDIPVPTASNKPDHKLSGSVEQRGQRVKKGLFTIAIVCFVFLYKHFLALVASNVFDPLPAVHASSHIL